MKSVYTGASGKSLDGLSKTAASNRVNELLKHRTVGIFRDDSWKPVTAIFDAMHEAGYDVTKIGSEYNWSGNEAPSSKTWTFEIDFVNNRDKPTKLYGRIIASGCGNVNYPLSSYDLVAYVS